MIHICYAFIYHFKVLDNVGIKIDSRYDYSYNPDIRELSITENDRFPGDFWGQGLYSLAAVVGNNGAGKSTVMSFLLDALLEGANSKDVKGVLVYERDGVFEVWGQDVKIKTKLPCKRITDIPKINCFYYCGHFMPYVSYNDMRLSELSGCYNASDGWLLTKDVQSYANIDTFLFDKPLDWHLRLFIAQNNHRICLMLANDDIRKALLGYCVPKFVQIGINMAGHYALIEKNRREKKETSIIPPRKIIHKDSRNRYIELIIYYSFLNLLNEGIWLNENETLKALEDWQDIKNNTDPVLEQFKSFIAKGWSNNLGVCLGQIHSVISQINEVCDFFDNGAIQTYYIEVNKDAWKLKLLSQTLLAEGFFLAAKYFDMFYSQELGGDTILSSGEQNLLDLFSRLYDAIVISPNKFANIESKKLIFLDEAEIGFHPDWQRKYIHLVIQFIRTLVQEKPGEDFQILINTHSPVLLSDIPNCCVNYLYKDNEGRVSNVSDQRRETFATNVFELYKDSFFMGSLIGEYARHKLEAIVQKIEILNQQHSREDDLEGLQKEICLIGDLRIREFLIRKMKGDAIEDEIAYHETRLKELKKKRRYE